MDLERQQLIESNRRWLETARRELAEHQEEVRRLQQEIHHMEIWLESVEKSRSADDSTAVLTEPGEYPVNEAESDIIEPELKGDRLREETVRILTEIFPQEMYYREILRQLTLRGFEVGGKDPGLNLLAHLAREPRVKRGLKRGVYTLSQMPE